MVNNDLGPILDKQTKAILIGIAILWVVLGVVIFKAGGSL